MRVLCVLHGGGGVGRCGGVVIAGCEEECRWRRLAERAFDRRQHVAAPECRPRQCAEEKGQHDEREPGADRRVKIAPENARTLAQPGIKHARQPARVPRPPQVEPGEHHHDRPACAKLEQVTAKRIDRPAAMQAAAQPRDPARRIDGAEIFARMRIHERGKGEAVVVAKEEDRRTLRIVAGFDRRELRARVVPEHGGELLVVSHAVHRRRNANQLAMCKRCKFVVPQVEHARDRLPQHERNDDERREEMPAPDAHVKALRACLFSLHGVLQAEFPGPRF